MTAFEEFGGGENMDEINEHFSMMKKIPGTAPVATYIELLKLMKDEKIKKEDLALACKIFLLINNKTSS